MNDKIKRYLVLIVLFVFILVSAIFLQRAFASDNDLKVVFFDVGQGDSIFKEWPKTQDRVLGNKKSQRKLNFRWDVLFRTSLYG